MRLSKLIYYLKIIKHVYKSKNQFSTRFLSLEKEKIMEKVW